ncbi:hypothetical protein [Microbacterium sp. 4-7]|uniref:hypothetical protein n=1 Tax=Microbacterium sp. 4-7 TaxID=1885327 RepID=UPI001650AA72|nr:hypothetical protein [Microbacterium sp. 4-7]MBC6495412.1 hypothetical protein [Microbacterium sp. 4-7]
MVFPHRRTRGLRALLAALGLATASLLIVGCTATEDLSGELPPQNVAEWSLPLDEFTYTSAPLRDYAEALLEKPCYAKHGIDWPVPWQPIDRTAGPSFSAGLQQLFTPELAHAYGYHRAPNDYENSDEWREFVADAGRIAETTPGFDPILEACRDESRSALPVPSDETLYYAVDAAQTINDEAELKDDVVAAGVVWAACMEDKGFGGLPPVPNEAPGDALIEKWQIGVPGTKASPEEIQMATADAECAEESGWLDAYYQTVWDLQVEFVTKNSDRLQRMRTELSEDRDRLLTAISENAPTK